MNPNVAQNLVAERPAQDCGHERVVYCDGGHPALGHPRVFINLVIYSTFKKHYGHSRTQLTHNTHLFTCKFVQQWQ